MATLAVTTLNLANDLLQWPERGPLIVTELERLAPDVVCFQEVNLPFNTARWLADRLTGYEVLLGPKGRHRGRTEASAILSRCPIEAHDRLELGAQDRVVQRAIVRQGDQRWEVANAHLHWSLRDDEVRTSQVQHLIEWLHGGLPTVICGDFNAKPQWKAVVRARQRFVSAHAVAHGAEPEYTFPTPLWRGVPLGPTTRWLARRILPLFTHRRAPWHATVDYIFVDDRVTVVSCDVAFDVAVAGRPWLYPSDHLGLAAVLRAASSDPSPDANGRVPA
jgi:endonuclease/exonuclease/phosphatase family metal-dependent hydrolase